MLSVSLLFSVNGLSQLATILWKKKFLIIEISSCSMSFQISIYQATWFAGIWLSIGGILEQTILSHFVHVDFFWVWRFDVAFDSSLNCSIWPADRSLQHCRRNFSCCCPLDLQWQCSWRKARSCQTPGQLVTWRQSGKPSFNGNLLKHAKGNWRSYGLWSVSSQQLDLLSKMAVVSWTSSGLMYVLFLSLLTTQLHRSSVFATVRSVLQRNLRSSMHTLASWRGQPKSCWSFCMEPVIFWKILFSLSILRWKSCLRESGTLCLMLPWWWKEFWPRSRRLKHDEKLQQTARPGPQEAFMEKRRPSAAAFSMYNTIVFFGKPN